MRAPLDVFRGARTHDAAWQELHFNTLYRIARASVDVFRGATTHDTAWQELPFPTLLACFPGENRLYLQMV